MSSATFAFRLRQFGRAGRVALRTRSSRRRSNSWSTSAESESDDVAEQLVGELAVRLGEQAVGLVGDRVLELRTASLAGGARELRGFGEPVVDERG